MIAEVIVDVSSSEVDKVFDYHIPENQVIPEGSRVLVPFGNRKIEGYIVNLKETSILPKVKLKTIIAKVDEYPAINTEMLAVTEFMQKKYNLKKVDIIRLCLPASMRKGRVKIKTEKIIKVSNNIDLVAVGKNLKSNAKNQIALIEYFKKNNQAKVTFLNSKFGNATVKKFIENNVFEVIEYEVKRSPVKDLNAINKQVILNINQEIAVKKITSSNKATTFVLNGVTGSGKTEVYMHCIKECQNNNKTAIMLVPEISLTPQVFKNFYARFGNTVAILHSGLSDGERFDEWRRIRQGEATIVVGARSAIFAPIKNVGIIIIDEEHDSSYFSESNPRYYTHEIAKFRSEYNKCPLILGSATPSIESTMRANKNEYILLELPIRVNNKEMPPIEIVDMASEILNGNNSMFSVSLQRELENTISKKNQAMIFINRRGFSSFLRCVDCGHIPKCTDCDVSLVYHKYDNQLKCHFCGKRYYAINKCPECGSFKMRQGGVGTQRVVEELKNMFPNVKILRMDNDTTTNKNAHSKILAEFSNTKPSILVGTQMIAKGHDFPAVTLVGIIDADLSLYFSDFASTERTFQLITQVAGRAGRDLLDGKVILQTYTPKHYVYKFASSYNYKEFYAKESNLRQVTNFPPYAKIIRVLITGENEEKTKDFLFEFYKKTKLLKEEYKENFIYLEAMKSPVKRVKNKYRYQILIRIDLVKEQEIIDKIYDIHNELRGKVVISFVEINPQNLS